MDKELIERLKATHEVYSGGGTGGLHIEYKMIEGLGSRDLHAIANGPIMDPNRIYLPAGKCSEEEVRRREA